jgi:uncharacterized coiled-coil DUF342 family protein
MTTPAQDEAADIAGLTAQRDFWKHTVDELSRKIGELLAERTQAAPPNPVVDTDQLVEHITYLESEVDTLKARVDKVCGLAVEAKAQRDRLLSRLLEVVAERDHLRSFSKVAKQ